MVVCSLCSQHCLSASVPSSHFLSNYDSRRFSQIFIDPFFSLSDTKMTEILPKWVKIWLFVSGVICLLDVIYTMSRPFTNSPDGFISNVIFYGWKLYSSVDVRYADTTDIVTCSTGRVMLFEITLNFLALYLCYKRSRHALLVAFTTTAFVFWKTVWYLSLYISPPTGNAPFFTSNYGKLGIFLIFWIPNGVWVVVPFLVLISLWNRLALPIEYQDQFNNSYEKPPGLSSP